MNNTFYFGQYKIVELMSNDSINICICSGAELKLLFCTLKCTSIIELVEKIIIYFFFLGEKTFYWKPQVFIQNNQNTRICLFNEKVLKEKNNFFWPVISSSILFFNLQSNDLRDHYSHIPISSCMVWFRINWESSFHWLEWNRIRHLRTTTLK